MGATGTVIGSAGIPRLIGGNSLAVQKIVLGLRNAGFGDAAVRVVYRNPTPRLLTASLLAEETV